MPEREHLRNQIAQMLQRVPPRVNSGGIQTAREFKKFHAQMTKTLAKSRLTIEQLTSAYNSTLSWYA